MYQNKITLKPQDILEKEFKIDARGYRLQEVDKFLDIVIHDYNEYNSVVIFGDIHGCYEPLKEWFNKHPFKEDTAYIFTGDYTDRGVQNKEVLSFLIGLSEYHNVLFLEGNHEKWLRLYSNDEDSIKPIDDRDFNVLRKYDKSIIKNIKEDKICSHEFIEHTVPQIGSMNKKALRIFCDKFAQMAYVKFRGKTLFVCHGGITCKPNIFIPTYQIINGVGKYDDTEALYEKWKDSDITIINAKYCYPRKQEDGNYSDDFMTILFRDNICFFIGNVFGVFKIDNNYYFRGNPVNNYFKIDDYKKQMSVYQEIFDYRMELPKGKLAIIK